MIKRKKTKIVATLGPASNNVEVMEEMILSGVDVFRINFSHAEHAEVQKKIKIIRELGEKLGSNTSILADLQGPKLRVGVVEEGLVTDSHGPHKVASLVIADAIPERAAFTT